MQKWSNESEIRRNSSFRQQGRNFEQFKVWRLWKFIQELFVLLTTHPWRHRSNFPPIICKLNLNPCRQDKSSPRDFVAQKDDLGQVYVLMCQKHQISLPVGYKIARPKIGDWEQLWHHFRTPGLTKNRFEWMNECVFIYCTYHIMSRGGLQCYWVRSDVSLLRRLWLPLSVHIWSHSPTQPMHEMYNETTDRPQHRGLCALLFSISVWVPSSSRGGGGGFSYGTDGDARLNLTPKGDHLGVAQAFCDPQKRPIWHGQGKFWPLKETV